jgi:phosphoglycolate phosphatase
VPEPQRAVVLDLDGTLVDTVADIHATLAAAFSEAGLASPTLPAVRGMIGDGARALIERALEHVGALHEPSEVDLLCGRFRERYAAAPCHDSTPYPGARAVLAQLRAQGWRLGLCTNKPQAATVGLLDALRLRAAFDAVVGGDLLPGIRKPDPRHLAAVLAELDVATDAAVMVGDSRNDLLTARALGVPCVLVSFGYTIVPALELGADAVIDRLADLPNVVRQLGRPRENEPPVPRRRSDALS